MVAEDVLAANLDVNVIRGPGQPVTARVPSQERQGGTGELVAMVKTNLPTPVLKDGADYEDWKLEVQAWQELMELPKSKQGLMLALSISQDHPMGLRTKVLGVGVGLVKLKQDFGVEQLTNYLDGIFKQDHFVFLYNLHKNFEGYKREKSETIEQYISCFEALILKMEEKNMKYPEASSSWKDPEFQK